MNRSLIGPEANAQAAKMLGGQTYRTKRRNPIGTIATWTADGVTQNLVLQFQVPQGFRFHLECIVQVFNLNPGSAGTYNPGDLVWTIDRNTPIGATAMQAIPVEDLAAISAPLGSVSPQYSEFVLPQEERFEPGDVIRSKVVVGVSVNPGAGYFTSIFKGYLTNTK